MLLAKTNEQYSAFKHEIDYCQNEIRKFEDRILDRMTESEALERNVKAAEADLGREKQQVEAEKKAARERTDIDKRELETLSRKRAEVAASMSRSVLSTYERIRKTRKGVGVAEAIDGRCSACQISLRLQFFQDLRRGDQVMLCESCGRILYYTPPPVEVDELGPGEQVSVE
jgi:predicted  nucleic acid-binding Zn-ribbon protein